MIVFMHVHVYVHVCTCTCMYVRMYTLYVHVYMHLYMYNTRSTWTPLKAGKKRSTAICIYIHVKHWVDLCPTNCTRCPYMNKQCQTLSKQSGGAKWLTIYNKIHVHVYREKSIPEIALRCPAFSNHGWLYYAWNTSAYYSYHFDYLLSLPFKGPCRTLAIYMYFRQNVWMYCMCM